MLKKDMEKPFKKKAFTARNKMMDYLARRDHSEKELRKKLSAFFDVPAIDSAIEFGKNNGWIPNDLEGLIKLSEKFANSLSRKKKGARYIQAKLKELGLPLVKANAELELEKALELVKNKYRPKKTLTFAEKQKIKGKMFRFLQSRGYEFEVIQKVMKLMTFKVSINDEGYEDDYQS